MKLLLINPPHPAIGSRIPREQLTPVAHPARAIVYLCTKEADDLSGKEFSLRDDDFRRRLELG